MYRPGPHIPRLPGCRCPAVPRSYLPGAGAARLHLPRRPAAGRGGPCGGRGVAPVGGGGSSIRALGALSSFRAGGRWRRRVHVRSARPWPLPSAPRAAPTMDPSGIIEALRGTMDPALREAAERQLNEVRAPSGLGRGRSAGERGRGWSVGGGAGQGWRGSPRLLGLNARGRGPFPPAASRPPQTGPGAHCPRTWQRGRAGPGGAARAGGSCRKRPRPPCLSAVTSCLHCLRAQPGKRLSAEEALKLPLCRPSVAPAGHSPAWDHLSDIRLWVLKALICQRGRRQQELHQFASSAGCKNGLG